MLAAAALAGDALGGATVMAAFGLGTLSSMLASSLAARRLLRWTHNVALRRAAGAAVLAMGLWIAAWPLAHLLDGADAAHHHAAAALDTGRQEVEYSGSGSGSSPEAESDRGGIGAFRG